MLFKVVSVLVACTASQVTSTTSTPSSTLASSTPTSTSTSTASRRILRRQLYKSAEDKLKNWNPIEFKSSTFVSKINSEEFGTGQPIGKWGAKVATILGFVGLAGGLVCGVLDQVLVRWGAPGILTTLSFYWNELFLVNTAFTALIFPTVYGLWKVTSARKAYGIMLLVDVVSYSVYTSFYYGTFLESSNTLKVALSIVAQCALAFVFLFNWYKVLFPTWTGIKDW